MPTTPTVPSPQLRPPPRQASFAYPLLSNWSVGRAGSPTRAGAKVGDVRAVGRAHATTRMRSGVTGSPKPRRRAGGTRLLLGARADHRPPMSSSPFATRYIVRADQTAGRFVLTERPIPPVQVTSPLEVWLVGGAARGGARPLPQSGARERFAIVRSPRTRRFPHLGGGAPTYRGREGWAASGQCRAFRANRSGDEPLRVADARSARARAPPPRRAATRATRMRSPGEARRGRGPPRAWGVWTRASGGAGWRPAVVQAMRLWPTPSRPSQGL